MKSRPWQRGRPPIAVLIFTVSIALFACAPEPPPLTRLDPDAKILAFGDSLTRGTGSNQNEDYPSWLAQLTRHEVINAGVPGELSRDGLDRLPQVLESTQPELMILCHGGNDMLRRKDLVATARNIQSMIEIAHARNIQVLLVGVPKPGLLLGTAAFYAEISAASKIPVELDILTQILTDSALKSDPIHPNGDGYKRLAEAIYITLQRAGAL